MNIYYINIVYKFKYTFFILNNYIYQKKEKERETHALTHTYKKKEIKTKVVIIQYCSGRCTFIIN